MLKGKGLLLGMLVVYRDFWVKVKILAFSGFSLFYPLSSLFGVPVIFVAS